MTYLISVFNVYNKLETVSITNQTYSTKETISFLYQIVFLRKVIREPGKRVKYRMYYEDDTINYQKYIFDIHPAFRKKFTNS